MANNWQAEVAAMQQETQDLRAQVQLLQPLLQECADLRNNTQDLRVQLQLAQQQLVLQQQIPAAPPERRGNTKIYPFNNDSKEDWESWKLHFRTTVRLNNFNNLECRLALVSAMKGKATTAVMDLDVDNYQNVGEMLEAYDRRFAPESASQLARAQFDQCGQQPGEIILDYHGRLRTLYNKAYPNENGETILIRRFTWGLRKKEIRQQVMRAACNTYGEALEAAQNEAAVLKEVKMTEMGAAAAPAEPMEIGAIQGGRKAGPGDVCHFCDKPGHWKGECNLLKKAKRFVQEEQEAASRSRRPTGAGRGGRATNDQRKKFNRNGPRLAAMEGEEDDDDWGEAEEETKEAKEEDDEGTDFC